MMAPQPLRSLVVESPASVDEANRLAYARGWTDGLPIIPPTEGRVRAMLAGTPLDPEELIGLVPPRLGRATVETIAVNAVMAGCLPPYLPVVIAALRGALHTEWNLLGIQATTHGVAPLLVIHGPIVEALEVNCANNVFGPGALANATIGRAVNLVLRNVGGNRPGELDRATQGQPGKFTMCIAENEPASPWAPLHVERGCAPEQSAVTVFAAGGTFDMNDRSSRDAESLLSLLAGSLTALAGNNFICGGECLVALCPEHVDILAASGLSKVDVQRELWERALTPRSRFPREWFRDGVAWPGPSPDLIPLVGRPEDVLVVVTGGAGRHSTFVPGFGLSLAQTCVIDV